MSDQSAVLPKAEEADTPMDTFDRDIPNPGLFHRAGEPLH